MPANSHAGRPRSKTMSRFEAYRNNFPNARLTRSKSGVLEVAFHTDGGELVFNGHTHEQFVDLFHQIGSDPDNRIVILTGSGEAFMALSALKASTSLLRRATTRFIARAKRSS
jgi:enoyl-CoA hydratase/carnithine racemase